MFALINFLRYAVQPMFEYSQENGFATMNYIFAGLSLLIILQPIDILIREKQLRKNSTSNSKSRQTVRFDDYDVGETAL